MLKIEAKINSVAVMAFMEDGVGFFDGVEPVNAGVEFHCSRTGAMISITEARDLHRVLTIVLKAIDSREGTR